MPVRRRSGTRALRRSRLRLSPPRRGFCGGRKTSAAGLRLYYDASQQASNLVPTIAGAATSLYLHSDGTACSTSDSSGVTTRFLDTSSPVGVVKCEDSAVLNFAGGNPFQQIGEWSLTQP